MSSAAVTLCALALLVLCDANIIVYTQETPHTVAEEFRDLPAGFGGEVSPDGLRGVLAVGEPRDGCRPLKPPNYNASNFTGKWIVLLARYNCSYELKIRNAQEAGYDCAIVHNVNSSELQTMMANNSEGIIIPSVFVSDLAGFILSHEYTYLDGFYIMINGDLPFNINTHLLLPFAVIVALCLVVMLIFMIVKCIKDRRRARRHRLPHRSLRKIPTCKFSKGDPYDTCAICLDDYQDGDRLRVLPCAHAYHAKCIDPWLTQNRRVCPVCKRRVFAAGERRRALSDSDSDDSREPLVNDDEAPATNATQGGTFVEQRENPFVRAARYMRGLRATSDTAPISVQNEPITASDVEDDNDPANYTFAPQSVTEDETAPLVTQSVGGGAAGGRRSRGGAGGRRARSAGEGGRGEIGVAALPAHAHTRHARL